MKRDDLWSAATNMHRRLGKWFKENYRPDKPFFIFMNYMEAHFPYTPPLPSPVWSKSEAWHKWDNLPVNKMLEYTLAGSDALSSLEISEMQTLYDEEILYLDRKLHELLNFFHASGLDENTLIIITSDHGEHFGEHHLLGHWQYVYEPLVRVPLIVRYQDRFVPGIEAELVQTHDIYSTILQLADVPWQPLAAHNCRSLLNQDRQETRKAVSEMVMTWLDPIVKTQHRFPEMDLVRLAGPSRAIQLGDWKLIVHADGAKELYDLGKDPLELKNLASEQAETVQILAKHLNDWLGSFNQYRPKSFRSENDIKISTDELNAIKTLGYTN
jgi:arylsulfatase A-like enzyme